MPKANAVKQIAKIKNCLSDLSIFVFLSKSVIVHFLLNLVYSHLQYCFTMDWIVWIPHWCFENLIFGDLKEN